LRDFVYPSGRPEFDVGVARLAAGGLRVGLGRTLAEWGGLTLAGAEGVVEPPGQLGDPGFEVGDTQEEFPAVGTRGLVHTCDTTIVLDMTLI
jgi:hypothetical protein